MPIIHAYNMVQILFLSPNYIDQGRELCRNIVSIIINYIDPKGIIHLKYLETTIGYTLFYYLFVSKIKIIQIIYCKIYTLFFFKIG